MGRPHREVWHRWRFAATPFLWHSRRLPLSSARLPPGSHRIPARGSIHALAAAVGVGRPRGSQRERRRSIYVCPLFGLALQGLLCDWVGPERIGPCLLVHRLQNFSLGLLPVLLRERDTTAFAVCALFGGWVILFSVFVGCLCTIFCAILRCSAERAFEMRVRGPVTDQFAVLQRLLPLRLRVRPGWPLALACMSSTLAFASPPLNWPRRKLQLSLGHGKSKIFFLFPSSLSTTTSSSSKWVFPHRHI